MLATEMLFFGFTTRPPIDEFVRGRIITSYMLVTPDIRDRDTLH